MAPSSKPAQPVAKAKAKAVSSATKPVAKLPAKTAAKRTTSADAAKPAPKPATKGLAKPPAKATATKAEVIKAGSTQSGATPPAPSKAKPVTRKPAAPAPSKPTALPISKATLPPVTKSKAPEAKSPSKSAPEKASAPAKAEKPLAVQAEPPVPEPAPAPRPSIVVAAPPNMPIRNTGNPNSPRPPMGRPNMPPSFAVRSPGRPGFAEGQATPPRPPGPKVEFKAGDHVVYPTHGVGTVQGIEVIEVAGMDHHMIVVTFDENRMTLRVPVNKVPTAGLRKLFTPKEFEAAIDTLKGRARIKRTMWSRRAQEYEAKINSGDPIQIAEVVRDLQRNAGQPDQSFSERQIYEQALERLAAEYAAIEKIDKLTASDQLVVFAKST